jgi:hypothetical protein
MWDRLVIVSHLLLPIDGWSRHQATPEWALQSRSRRDGLAKVASGLAEVTLGVGLEPLSLG